MKHRIIVARKKKPPSKNYCVLCGRHTNDKKYFGDSWTNYFFSCNTCKKVWCTDCLGQVTGKGSRKTYKFGRKGQISCPDCGNFMPMIQLPVNLPFIQDKTQERESGADIESGSKKTCSMCGQKISQDAKFCDYCGQAV